MAGAAVRVLLAVPTPPPYSGPEINGATLLHHGLGTDVETRHLHPGIRTHNRSKGRITAAALLALARLWLSAVARLALFRPHVLYLYLAQNRTGFIRDAVLILTGRAFGVRVIAHVRGGNFENYYRHAPPAERRFIRSVLGRLSRVVLVAGRFREQFRDLLPDRKVVLIYNGIDDDLHEALGASRPPRSGCHLLFMGHLSAAKGFLDLVRALPRVLAVDESIRFAAAGEWLESERNIHFDEEGRAVPSGASLREEWKALEATFGHRAAYLGRLDPDARIRALLDADIFVLPSYSEGFPMAALEAMAAALPLVVTPVGALPEILDAGRHAVFVRPGDPASLADALLALAADPARRAAMGAANRALVAERYTFAAAQSALRSIIADVVAGP